MSVRTLASRSGAGAAVPANPPRENLYRATRELGLTRTDPNGMPTLTGHFARWNEWTEIRSAYEGNFMERFSPTAMTKTLAERTPKVLFNHGKDPQIGDKVLGPVGRVAPDAEGAYYEVPLLDTSYNRDLIPGLEAGLYGASFRFSVMQEDVVKRPKKSDYNPRGIPERTVSEARVMEFGPVTFPAYAGATAGIRSITDDYILARFNEDELARAALGYRYDNEDIGCLAQMLVLAAKYIDEQDEPGDGDAAAEMQRVVVSLSGLLQGETTEPEPPDEPEGEDEDGMYSEDLDGEERAVWSTAYMNNLPDSSFLYIEDGGKKDSEGKTVPRSLRHFPVKDADGKVDLPHLRNALSRIPQSDLPQSVKDEAAAKARKMLAAAGGRMQDEPGLSEATTRHPGTEPEPYEATTHSVTRDLFWFAKPPKHL